MCMRQRSEMPSFSGSGNRVFAPPRDLLLAKFRDSRVRSIGAEQKYYASLKSDFDGRDVWVHADLWFPHV